MDSLTICVQLFACVLLVGALIALLWRTWRTLKELPTLVLELMKDEAKSHFGRMTGRLSETLNGPIETLLRQTNELKAWQKMAAGYEAEKTARGRFECALKESTADNARLVSEKAALEKDALALKQQLSQTRETLARLECDHQVLSRRLDSFIECLPAEGVDRIYRAITIRCPLAEIGEANRHYLFSSLAILVAAGQLQEKPEDKRIRLRDAFDAFDGSLYARFASAKTLLATLRVCFEAELAPLLQGTLIFRWPAVGDAFESTLHKKEQENGLSIITEVKSAVVHSTSGVLIHKAIVVT